MRHEWDFNPDETLAESRARIVDDLNLTFAGADAEDILRQAHDMFGQKLALVSSFGAESVVLLDLAARISRDIPVLFIDTRLLFAETLDYQAEVAAQLGLRDVRRISTDEIVMRLSDVDDDLHERNPDDCCHLRKTVPLEAALSGFDAWVSGRKRHQTPDRAEMAHFEIDAAGPVKVNPLANWDAAMVAAYFERHDLPRHPLVARGYPSIGCMPCTSAVAPGDDPRSGRWRGQDKTECGIHIGPDGRVVRSAA